LAFLPTLRCRINGETPHTFLRVLHVTVRRMYGLFGTEIQSDAPHERNAYRHLHVAFVEPTGSEPTTQIRINLSRDGDTGYNPSEAVAFGRVTSGQYGTIPSLYSKYGADVPVQRLISGGAKYADAAFPKLSKIISITIDTD
jgi:hypothetical protein